VGGLLSPFFKLITLLALSVSSLPYI
jgi:hypothetical protein